jgi:hypothetical protein
MRSKVDWRTPSAPPDPVYGTGALREERMLAQAVAVLATGFVLVHAYIDAGIDWSLWQYALAAVLAFDLCGGVVANGLNSAKRDHFAEESALESTKLGRLVRRPVLFTAIHVQPVVVGLAFPGASWWWGLCWYAVSLITVVLVSRAPLYMARPLALSVCVLVALVAPLLTHPGGFAWLPVVMVLKLTLAHAVREEPYRPSGVRTGA